MNTNLKYKKEWKNSMSMPKDIGGNNFFDVINADKKKFPIYKGCPNTKGDGCFCTGDCREVVGWIELDEGFNEHITFIKKDKHGNKS